MINVAVCDDDDLIVKRVEFYILQFASANNVDFQVYKYSSGESLIKSEKQYDLIFLDVEMNGISGINVAEMIRKTDMDTPIVFITSYSDYSMEAHTVHAFDFIKKPFEYSSIERILNDFNRIGEKRRDIVIELKTSNGIRIQPVEEIIYIMVGNKRELYIYVTSQNNAIKLKGNLSDIFSCLNQNQFFIPHRSYIINLNYVKFINEYKSILMSNGDNIPLTRANKEKFREKMHRFISNKGASLK